MKKLILLGCILSLSLFFYSCSDDDNDDGYKTYPVSVQLVYPETSEFSPVEGIAVKLTNTGGSTFDAVTDATGKASFVVPSGIYNASVTDRRSLGGSSHIFNGTKSNITVTDAWTGTESVDLSLSESKSGQIIIKELYSGGCPKDDGSGAFQYDKYVVLYNNSEESASLENVCLAIVLPYNSTVQTNKDYKDGVLIYEAEGWIPAGTGIWYFPSAVTIEPGKQLVVALANAIDNTKTYSKSINFSNPEYYCLYDIQSYPLTLWYPSPVETIPTSHYLKAVHYGTGTAWPVSNTSPAFFLFATEKVSPVEFANDANRTNLYDGLSSQVRKKVPVEWVVDGIEVFQKGSATNFKRLTATVDAGQAYLTNQQGYSLYRNVDKAATEALAENKDKLIYSYNMGTDIDGAVSTDPSGIDAEASIKKGARIVYQDTNNSTSDFHQRKQASLKD